MLKLNACAFNGTRIQIFSTLAALRMLQPRAFLSLNAIEPLVLLSYYYVASEVQLQIA